MTMDSIKFKLEIFLIWVYAAFVIFQGNTVYIFLTKSNQVVIILALAVLTLIVGNSGKLKIQRRTKNAILFYLILDIGIFSLINISTPSLLFLTLSFPLLLILFQNKENIMLFLKALSNLMCKLRSNGMPVPLLRNGYSIFNGTKYR